MTPEEIEILSALERRVAALEKSIQSLKSALTAAVKIRSNKNLIDPQFVRQDGGNQALERQKIEFHKRIRAYFLLDYSNKAKICASFERHGAHRIWNVKPEDYNSILRELGLEEL